MAINLEVSVPIPSVGGVQVVDSNNNPTGLLLGKESTEIQGKDTVGKTLPLTVIGVTAGQKMGSGTLGRIIRMFNTAAPRFFWDIGIDQVGSLFVNAGDRRILTLAFPETPGNVNES
jgi:hypothetical protein